MPEEFRDEVRSLHTAIEGLAANMKPSPSQKIWDIAIKAMIPLVMAVGTWMILLQGRVMVLEAHQDTIERAMTRAIDRIEANTSAVSAALQEMDRRMARIEANLDK